MLPLMEIYESMLLFSFVLLLLVAYESKIQAEGIATEKVSTCIQPGNCEWERTLDDQNLKDYGQDTDEDMEEGNEENMYRSSSGIDHFATSDLKTDDEGQPRYKVENVALSTYEYPPLTRRVPGKVSDTQEVEYSPGQVLKLIT
ncbi:hypothetical protein CHS0354_029050 [Potamilus streckersoni]|uniref:Uncharacterized protein n=1 Tax=Potamilus streckersoni TaxID=2493646 RepID=A0AAE0SRF5_9BIVA|nr:hypothetical protein CHS0354_029050 [Potamilus streckersoni]